MSRARSNSTPLPHVRYLNESPTVGVRLKDAPGHHTLDLRCRLRALNMPAEIRRRIDTVYSEDFANLNFCRFVSEEAQLLLRCTPRNSGSSMLKIAAPSASHRAALTGGRARLARRAPRSTEQGRADCPSCSARNAPSASYRLARQPTRIRAEPPLAGPRRELGRNETMMPCIAGAGKRWQPPKIENCRDQPRQYSQSRHRRRSRVAPAANQRRQAKKWRRRPAVSRPGRPPTATFKSRETRALAPCLRWRIGSWRSRSVRVARCWPRERCSRSRLRVV